MYLHAGHCPVFRFCCSRGLCGGRYKTRTCGGLSPMRPALAAVSARQCRAQRASHEVTSSSGLFTDRKSPQNRSSTGLYGGRYKTRTCDLPHVKRMRYQLRQSSFCFKQGVFYTMCVQLSRVFFQHVSFPACTSKKEALSRSLSALKFKHRVFNPRSRL